MVCRAQLYPSALPRLLVGIHLADCGWSTRGSVAYAALKQCLYDAIRLAVPNPNKQLCLFTDASSTGCSILVTQTDKVELDKPLLDQKHEIVFITTHRWTDAECKWHVSSQEAFPIIFAFQRLDFLFTVVKWQSRARQPRDITPISDDAIRTRYRHATLD